MTKLSELREKAERASKGPWQLAPSVGCSKSEACKSIWSAFLAYKARIDRLNLFVKNVKKFLKDMGEDPEIHPLFRDMDEIF